METFPAISYQDIEQFIGQLRHPATVLQFRGQSCDNCGWTLRPALARDITTAAQLVQRQRDTISEFMKRIKAANLDHRLMINGNPRFNQAEWEILEQAQHYELPTILMDFSLDWRRSLFFAVHNPAQDAHDGQLWVYQAPYEVLKSDNIDDPNTYYFRESPLDCKAPLIANPAFYWNDNVDEQIAARRRFVQMGRFLVQSPEESLIPLEQNPRFDPYLLKIVIPSDAKPSIRRRLSDDGLSMDMLYYRKDRDIESIVSDLKRY